MAPPSPRAPSAGGRLAVAGLFVGVVALCGMLSGYRELTRIQLADPVAGPPLAEPAAAAATPAVEWPAGQPLPSSLAFPEVQHLFDILDPSAAVCIKPLGASLQVAGLQSALQACLGHSPACACVAWDEAAGTAQLGSSVTTQQQRERRGTSRHTVLAARRGCRQAPCAPPAAAGGGGSIQRALEGCPPGMHEVASDRGSLICNPCPGGYCGALPGAELLPLSVLDAPLQAALASPPFAAAGQAGRPTTSLHGINPSAFEWQGRRMVAARATNFGNCAAVDKPPAAGGSGEAAGQGAGAAIQAARRRLAGEGGEGTAEEAEEKERPPIFVSFVTLCDLGSAAEPVGTSPASRCRLLQVDMAALAAQVPNMTLIDELQGVEDPRGFVHNGAAYLLVTLHLLGPETPQQRLAKGRKRLWSDAGAPLHNFMAALRLNPALDAVESGAVLRCEALNNTRQKNFMPLQLASGELYVVTDVQPLTVVQPDLRTGACRVVHREGTEAVVASRGSSVPRSALAGGSDRGSGSDGTLSDPAAFNGAAAFAGVLGGGHVHGGSPFVHIGKDLHLSVVHHMRRLPYGGIYTHHLALLRATPGRFRVDWLSEAFRFPDRPGAKPLALDVQFAPSLTLHGDDLLIGFGVGDCHSELVRVPAFCARLAAWLRSGMGTQLGRAPALHLGQLQPQLAAYPGPQPGGLASGVRSVSLIRWEAAVYSDTDDRWAATAAAIGGRWAADPAINASARLVLRYLDRPDAGWGTPRSVGGLPVIDSNQQLGLIPDVAISHAGADGLTRAVGRAWLPWLPALGMSLDNTTAQLLRRHAAKVLVPSAFHRTSLMQSLGLKPSQVAVLPQPHTGDGALCPPHFVRSGGSKPDRDTLAHVLGQQASALRSFVFLHQAPAAWQYGAELLLEAFAAGWSAADDVSLVLSLLPPADEDEETPGASWTAYIDALQQRVDALSGKQGAPHVALVTRLPRLGRWEERLLQAADAAVLPYLGGSAGRELLLAASCGKAVVTTAGGPAADVLPGNSSAWLVPAQPMRCRPSATPAGSSQMPGGGGQAARPARLPLACLQVQPADLAAAMHSAWRDAAGRRQRGTAAREAAHHWAKDTAGWDTVAAQLWRHVQGLLPADASQVA